MQLNMLLAALFAGAAAAASASTNLDAAFTNGATVVYSTRVQTVFSCGPDVTDCPTLTSVIDQTTTICPVTASLKSSAEIVTSSPAGSTVTMTKTAAVSSAAASSTAPSSTAPSSTAVLSTAASSTAASSTAASSTTPPTAPAPLHSTLGSPETTSAIATTSVIKYTSFVFSTVTAPANISSTVSGPTGPANSTTAHTTVSGSIGAPSSRNGTLSTTTAPGTNPSQSIVPYTGDAAGKSISLLLALVVVAASFCI